jgi:allantoinase
MPDVPNWCWHEYGNRVGFWRLLEVYDEFRVPGVMNINGAAVGAFPDIVKACVERKWEFVGHGSVHPYIMGAPHRVKYFRKIFEKIRKKNDVLFWTGEQIADWYLMTGPKVP